MTVTQTAATAPQADKLVEIDGDMLAALLASRVCHDLAGPINALNNGVEFLQVAEQGGRDQALGVISDGAVQASARLQFFRMAFGASGSQGAPEQVETLRDLMNAYLAGGRATLDWQSGEETVPRSCVQLLLNIALVAYEALPRGGILRIAVMGGDRVKLVAMGEGPAIKFDSRIRTLLAEGRADLEEGPLLSKEAPALLAHRLARKLRAELSFGDEAGRVLIAATV
ncbi:MAG: histidine phosphotransferase family protein [Neomegalonema sp.]|nr:histidine phosphotransferase family protein [Neomegalonema sp.]